MKFFSNEKENDTQQIPERDDRAASEPVTVPPQRAGSPWSDAPRDPSATDSREDGPRNTDSGTRNAGSADSETADRDRRDDGAATTTTYGPDGTEHAAAEAYDPDRTAPINSGADRTATLDADPDRTTAIDSDPDRTTVVDSDSDADRTAGFGSDAGRSTTVGSDEDPATDRTPVDAAIKDDGSFDSPKAVDPATDKPLENDSERTGGYRDGEEFQPASDHAPVVAAAAVPAAGEDRPSASGQRSGSGSGDKLLPDGDSFAERFRDIQLRFVDEPKEATAEAATLVGEAVDKLTSALKSQRDGLAGNSDDTEKLRVELRAYRDILNRLLAL